MKRGTIFFSILFFHFIAITQLMAQLSGQYFIGLNGDFASFQEACDSIMSRGVAGDTVKFIAFPGVYEEQVQCEYARNTNDSTIIVFASSSDDPEQVIIYHEPSSSDDNFIFYLKNTGLIEFKNIKFHSYHASYSRAILLEGNIHHLNFENCIFQGTFSNNNDLRHALIFGNYNSISELNVSNCQFLEGSHGIYLDGERGSDITLTHNQFNRVGYVGIWIRYSTHVTISGNHIVGSSNGINISYSGGADSILNNRIEAQYQSLSYHQDYSQNSLPSLIMNNLFIANVTGGSNVEFQYSKEVKIYHNTMIAKSHINDAKNVYIRRVQGSSNLSFKNNIIVNFYKGYSIYNENENAVSECDYNVYYSCGLVLGYWLSDALSLEELQQLSGMDTQSRIGVPFLKTSTDYIPTSSYIDNMGTPLEIVTDDLLGNPRDPSTPDVGAIEFQSLGEEPLGGIYVIGQTGDFPNLQEGIYAALLRGINNHVTFAYQDGIYPCRDTIFYIPSTNEENRIHVTSLTQDTASVQLTGLRTGERDNYYTLMGSRHVLIDYLTFDVNERYEIAIVGDGYLSDVAIDRNRFDYYEYDANARLDGINLNPAAYSDVTISNNHFRDMGKALEANHTGSEYRNQLIITGNQFDIGYSIGNFSNLSNFIFADNVCMDANSGIQISTMTGKIQIHNNILSARYNEAISISQCTFFPYDTSMIFNNFLFRSEPNYSNRYSLLQISSSNYLWVTNNNLYGFVDNGSYGMVQITNSEHLNFLNNIVMNDTSGYAFYLHGANPFDQSDYNVYSSDGSNLAYWNGTVCQDLQALQNASGMESHSFEMKVNYAANNDLHINEPQLDNQGLPLAFVKTDIDGDYRHPTTPDIGADEFTPFPQNPPYLVQNVPDQTINEDSHNVLLFADLSEYFADPDSGDILTYTLSASPSTIHFTLLSGGGGQTALYATPEPDFYGETQVTITCTDVTNLSVADTFTIVVQNIPDTPVAGNDYFEFSVVDSVLLDVLANDSDADGDSLKIISLTPPDYGTAVISKDSTHIIYYSGISSDSVSFDYTVRDPSGLTATATIFIHLLPLFVEEDYYFPALSHGSVYWVDVDNDDDLDLFMAGGINGYYNQTQTLILYNDLPSQYNFNRTFYFPSIFPGSQGSCAWGDYNGDGWQDVLISGIPSDSLTTITTKLFKNNSGHFELVDASFPAAYNGKNLFFDYDNDGDLDILISGQTSISPANNGIIQIYRNNGPNEDGSCNFSLVTDFLNYPIIEPEVVACDFDNNGYTDLLVSGRMSNACWSVLYLHFESSWENISLNPPLYRAHFSVMDYDADGDLDVLYSGLNLYNSSLFEAGIWKNTLIENGNALFDNIPLNAPVKGGQAEFCDFDLDGDVDILIFGHDSLTNEEYGIMMKQDASGFQTTGPVFPGNMNSTSFAVGDYNLDQKPDLFIMADTIDASGGTPSSFCRLFKNTTSNTAYHLPLISQFFAPQVTDRSVTISWSIQNPVGTGTPPVINPTFNVGVQTHFYQRPHTLSPAANVKTGFRKLVGIGNNGKRGTFTINNLTSGKQYFFYVQIVGQNYNSTPFKKIAITTTNPFFQEYSIPEIQIRLNYISSADINGDGYSDIYLSSEINPGTNDNFMLKRTSYYNMDTLASQIPSNGITKAIFVDLDRDGDLDRIDCILKNPTGGFPTVPMIFYEWKNDHYEEQNQINASGFITEYLTSDMDHDGDEDLLVSDRGNIAVYYLENFSLDHVEIIREDPNYYDNFDVPFDVADINRDGTTDIIFVDGALNFMISSSDTFMVHQVQIPPTFYPQIKFLEGVSSMDQFKLVLTTQENPLNGIQPRLYVLTVSDQFNLLQIDSTFLGKSPKQIATGDFNNNYSNDIFLTTYTDGVSPSASMFMDPENPLQRLNTYSPNYVDPVFSLIKNQNEVLELALAGISEISPACMMVNRMVTQASKPAPPTNLRAEVTDSSIIFMWDPSSTETQYDKALTYNLRIGTAPGGGDVKPPHADSTGLYWLLQPGNAGQALHWELKNVSLEQNYYWSVQTLGPSYQGSEFAPEQAIILTDIKENEDNLPTEYALFQNYPNPFNPITTIRFAVPQNDRITITVYNSLGQKVTTLLNKKVKAGFHKIQWDGTGYPSGIYFIRMTGSKFTDTRKMMLIK